VSSCPPAVAVDNATRQAVPPIGRFEVCQVLLALEQRSGFDLRRLAMALATIGGISKRIVWGMWLHYVRSGPVRRA